MNVRRIQLPTILTVAAIGCLLLAGFVLPNPNSVTALHGPHIEQPGRPLDYDIRLASATEDQYPPGELGETIRLGEKLVTETKDHELTKPFVGNLLSCTSCHLDSGRHPKAASFIGVASAYPAYSPRENAVITLEERIIQCFLRSQNGKRPPAGGKVTVAIAAYITWLSQQMPLAMNPKQPLGPNHIQALQKPSDEPNVEIGETLYADRCASCHAESGSGTDDGPPVWGDRSFNDGAGLSKVPAMAAWLKVAMPLDDTDLTDQEAYDIAAFINSHSRPRFKADDGSRSNPH